MRLFQNSHFLLVIRFSQYIHPPTIFFQYYANFIVYIGRQLRSIREEVEVRKYCAVSKFRRYIQSKLRFTKGDVKVRKKSSHVVQYTICEHLKRFPRTKGTLWMFRRFYVSFSSKTT